MPIKSQPSPELDRLARENARLRGDLLTIASRVSHDLRTPLGSIMNSGELMREILLEKDPASAVLIEPLFTSVDELQRLIKGISMVSKASVQPFSKSPVKMDEIVSGVLQQTESRILKNKAEVKSPEVWPEVEGVPGWLAFIWSQLIVNALQHGGAKIQLGWKADKHEHRFWITDNGEGVPESWRVKLFQPFDSLHEADSTRGLGLSIVQRLVELQGGNCGHEDTDGTCFFFTLPLKNSAL